MMIQTKNLLCVEPPLTGHCSEKEFKIYFNDIGLLSAMLSTSDRLALLTDSIFNYKGYIIENLVADMLFKLGNELYYFEKDGYEIDFVVQGKDKINVLEVKASNKRSKSLDYFINKYNYDYNYYKIIDGNIGTQKYTSIPLFLAFLIR
jgi:predicted AAA+ superfamily ATPase